MNRDEFRFLILNTPSLWQEGVIEADEEGQNSVAITETGLSLRKFDTYVLATTYPLGPFSPVDLAFDACGLLYLLDAAGKGLLIFDTNAVSFQRVRCLSFAAPRAIEVDAASVYVADGNEVLCLAKANYQTRWETPVGNATILDMALDSHHSLYVLDGEGRQVFVIDRAGKLAKATLTAALEAPVSIAIDREDNLYVLEYARKQVLRFDTRGTLAGATEALTVADFQPSALAVDTPGNIYIGDKRAQGVPYQIEATGKAVPVGYQGAAMRLALSRQGDLYILSSNEIAFLKLVERYVSQGSYVTKALDSTVFDCQWHKVVIDADIPANTGMSVSSYIANAASLPPEPSWSAPMVNFRDALLSSPRGRYIWFKIALSSDDLHAQSPQVKSLAAYFPRLSYLRYLPATYQEDETSREFLERFLSLFETFFSGLDEAITTLTRYIDSEATPGAFLPWLASWLALAYDENWEEGKVRKLLGQAPELYPKRGTREGMEAIIGLFTGEKPIIVENFQLRGRQNQGQKSRLVKQAAKGGSLLYLQDTRGFEAEDIIKISDGTRAEFAVVAAPGASTLKLRGKLGADYDAGTAVGRVRVEEVLYGDGPYLFCVLLKPSPVRTAGELNAVRRMVEREKPAHTVGGVRDLQPWFYLDMHTYLDINTRLTEPVFILGESSAISRDTVLSDREASGQIDRRSRVGMDTKLT